MMSTILTAVVVLGVLIFVHELGHFLVAKAFGVGVQKFSLGFGRKLVGWRWGETEYLVSAFPLGGYVKMVGEGEDDELSPADQARSFQGKHPFKRMLVVFAGPFFNLLFAWLVMTLLLMWGVPTLLPKVGSLMEGKPAVKAGLRAGDIITAIDGEEVRRWEEIPARISARKGAPVALSVKRGEERLELTITPERQAVEDVFGDPVERLIIGISPAEDVFTERYGPVEAVTKGAALTADTVAKTLTALKKLVMRAISLDNLGGPIMIFVESGRQLSYGVANVIAFMALLSVNLAVFNLLPIPILDGGHLLFYGWELVTRRPVSDQVRDLGQRLGLAFLLCLLLLSTYNDFVRYWKDITSFLTGAPP
jgi:regulator of sigma E protease